MNSRYLTTGTAVLVTAFMLSWLPASAQQMPAVAKQVLADKESAGEEGTSRVFGGGDAKQGDQPWQVALAWSDMLDDSPTSQFDAQFCGGSLIGPRWVLTAAHCVTDDFGDAVSPSEFTVLYGDIDVEHASRIEPSRVIVHEDYDNWLLENDIALVELSAPLNLDGQKAGAIAIADPATEQAHAQPNTPVVVTGWGKLENGYFPVILQQATLDIVDTHVCSDGLLNLYQRQLADALNGAAHLLRVSRAAAEQAFQILVEDAGELIPSTMLCAGTASGVRDSCNGDSGGPLFVTLPDGAVQVGIVSWGEVPIAAESGCGNPQLYGYYTRVSSYHDWIERNAQ